ncbi:MAG TPA: hypothetical protein VGM30_21435 [Puia sp.]|jgi:hypothetical protein
MAINQNHLFEELNGIKCAIVEKNASPQRVDFLRRILEYNRFTVVVVPSPPPKAAAPAPAPKPTPAPAPAVSAPSSPAALVASSDTAAATPPVDPPATASIPTPAPPSPPPAPPPPPAPETFTIGVTDVTFNPTNAIFGRLLKVPGGHIVTLAYWQQKDNTPHDEIPYFDAKY